jgi:hypothetical protein
VSTYLSIRCARYRAVVINTISADGKGIRPAHSREPADSGDFLADAPTIFTQ